MSDNDRLLVKPGTTLEFADMLELHAFEDVLAPTVQPSVDMELWSNRVPLKEILRPPKFNGRLGNIALTHMDDAYERMIDAKDRGWQSNGRNYQREFKDGSSPEDFVGFTFTADAMSSGRGTIGQVQAELWYAPNSGSKVLPVNLDGVRYDRIRKSSKGAGDDEYYAYSRRTKVRKYGATSGAQNSYARPLVRVVTKPKLESERFEELRENSKRIGFQVLLASMKKPIRNGLHN